MTPSRARFIASSFSDYQGFKVVPYPRQLKIITPDGKSQFFLKEEALFKYAGNLLADRIFSTHKTTLNKEKNHGRQS